MDREMFYGASKEIFSKAKHLRENMTEVEQLLWSRLKENQMQVRFKPQHPADIFILDFYCHSLKLAIELDGEIHLAKKEYDSGREHELMEFGIQIIRFTNTEVLQDIESVISKIKQVIQSILDDKSASTLPTHREGSRVCGG